MIAVIIVMAVVVLFGPHLWAKQVIARYNQRQYFSGDGFELARRLLERAGLKDVAVEAGQAGDHYDPIEKVIRLNHTTCGRRSLTAVVVAAHEVGHAVQDHTHYPPLKVRTRLMTSAVKIERIGAGLMMAVPVLTALTRIPAAGLLMLLGGLASLCTPLLVHLVTLPTEFDASFNRALPMLSQGGYIPTEDIPAARKILRACALTYVASALMGLLNIWRWVRLLRR